MSDKQEELLAMLANAAGISQQDLRAAISAAVKAEAEPKQGEERQKSVYQDRELIYDDENAFIFRRGNTKSRTYYIRIYDKKSRKPFVKSLGETDRVAALAKARIIYQEIKGKVSRGERLKAITNRELVTLYLEKIEKRVTTVPQQGITPETLRLKKYFLGIWLRFIESVGFSKTPIDQIQPARTREFGQWFFNLPKESGGKGPRWHYIAALSLNPSQRLKLPRSSSSIRLCSSGLFSAWLLMAWWASRASMIAS